MILSFGEPLLLEMISYLLVLFWSFLFFVTEIYIDDLEKDITALIRGEYKILERKTEAKEKFSSNENFLRESNIRVTVNKNCLEEIDRIYELVTRTNQLNFTKNRQDKKQLIEMISSDWNDNGYVSVRDKFGDYGLVAAALVDIAFP